VTLGEAINARAAAGARMVEARQRLVRAEAQARTLGHNAYHALARRGVELARDALAVAEIDYAAALGVQRSLDTVGLPFQGDRAR
jgi:hypothetical protein